MFKVGDKVRVINSEDSFHKNGDEGIVVDIVTLDSSVLYDVKVSGLVQGYFAEDIEKVAEQVAKFKVGDKVRAISSEYLFTNKRNDWTGIVTHVYETGGFRAKSLTPLNEDGFEYGGLDQNHFELISSKLTKNQRISTLEKEVEALKSEVAALKLGDTVTNKVTVTTKEQTPNEQRKAVISEAKAFVEESKNRDYFIKATPKITSTSKTVFFTNDSFGGKTDEVEFVVNTKKRTVVAIIRTIREKYIVHKGIAKCAPTDVFNVDIGKAIALGRALGLDVSKFEQAVQPTEVVVGMEVYERQGDVINRVTKMQPDQDWKTLYYGGGKAFTTDYGFLAEGQVDIVSDTEAKY